MDAPSDKRPPQVFQGFWHGRPLNPILLACLTSFIKRGHEFHLYTYDELQVPTGVKLKSAEAVLPRESMFSFVNPDTQEMDFGPFSDLFRFKLLMLKGGWWSDVDCICLSSNVPAFERAWARECPECAPTAIGTSQMALRKDDPVARELFGRCSAKITKGFNRREDLGPRLMSAVINDLGLPRDMGGTSRQFYPLRWIEMFKLWLPQFYDEVADKGRRAYFMPIYQSFSRYSGLSMGILPPQGSFLDSILTKFFGNFDEKGRHTEEGILANTRMFFQKRHAWAIDELVAVSGPDVLGQIGLPGNISQTR